MGVKDSAVLLSDLSTLECQLCRDTLSLCVRFRQRCWTVQLIWRVLDPISVTFALIQFEWISCQGPHVTNSCIMPLLVQKPQTVVLIVATCVFVSTRVLSAFALAHQLCTFKIRG